MLPSMEEERESDVQTVEDAMRDGGEMTLRGAESLSAAMARAAQVAGRRVLPRRARRRRVGRRLAPVLERLHATEAPDAALRTFVTPLAPPYLYPDQSTATALRVLRGRPFVPVVHRADPTRLEGALALDDVLRAVASPGGIE